MGFAHRIILRDTLYIGFGNYIYGLRCTFSITRQHDEPHFGTCVFANIPFHTRRNPLNVILLAGRCAHNGEIVSIALWNWSFWEQRDSHAFWQRE